MTVLSLLRHAKSSWDDSTARDFDRPLNDRGRRAAKRMGEELRHREIRFDHVLASPAARVRQTLDVLAQGYGALPELQFDDRVYAATERTLLALVQALPGEAHAPLIVGHNPGLHRLLLTLIGGDERVTEKFPTAAFAMVELPAAVRWPEVVPGTGRLQALIVPRDLD